MKIFKLVAACGSIARKSNYSAKIPNSFVNYTARTCYSDPQVVRFGIAAEDLKNTLLDFAKIIK